MSLNLEILKIALDRNEFGLFLTGDKTEYYLVCPYADMPTDPDQVFDSIKEHYTVFNNADIWSKFQNEILVMTDNVEGAWLSLYYLSMYLSYRNYKGKDLINLSFVIEQIQLGLSKFQNELRKNTKWGGQFVDGLWGDSVRLVSILNKKFDLDIKI